jgi:hypothetical protein
MTNDVGDQIVWGLADRFEAERDPIRRQALRTLLIEEEDRFGERAERLDRAEAHIASSNFRIQELEKAITRLRGDGHDVRTAERALTSMKDLLKLFGSYRDTLLDDLGRNGF